MIPLIVGAAIVFVSVVIETAYLFRSVPLDSYDPGPWKTTGLESHGDFSQDVRSLIYRLDKAEVSQESWAAVIERLDELHAELSPFGENSRRPPYVRRRWYGETVVTAEAPDRYNKTYLQTYLETLENLAGVIPDE